MPGSSPTFVAVAAILGFLLVTASSSVSQARRAEEPRRAELIELIEARRSQVADLDEAVRSLRAELDEARLRVSRMDRSESDRAQRALRLAALAGTTELRGRGVVVRLSDSGREPPSSEDASAYRIHDTDLQLVVNALLDAGAEAVAINESRLVATSAIRAAGETIVVNFRPLTPPYEVVAIGADRQEYGETEIATRFRRWNRLFGLGYSVSDSEVTVPAYAGRVAIANARTGR